jgi:uncharacterized protein YbjT (DUF2867 family)
MMRGVLVTGASGFTGRHVVSLLLERYGTVACYVRPTSNLSSINKPGVEFHVGDIDDPKSLAEALSGKDVLINIAFLAGKSPAPQERAEGIVQACREAEVKRAIVISSTSIFTTLSAPAKKAKLAAEQAVMKSGLDYSILRPTMIYGGDGDRNMSRLLNLLRRSPVVLIPGDGKSKQQPIHVADLAKAIVECIDVRETFGKSYNLSGARSVTLNEVIDESCKALGVRRRVKIHFPVAPALWLASISRRVTGKAWIKEEQILRLNEDKVFDHEDARRDFGFAPRDFTQGIRQEASLSCSVPTSS